MLVITFKNIGASPTAQEWSQLNLKNSFLKIQNDCVCIYHNGEMLGVYKDFVSIFYADEKINEEEK